MPRITIELSTELYQELQSAVAEADGMGPATWAAECVESTLASRRLPHVIPSTKGARMIETMLDAHPRRVERRACGPMNAAEIPSVDDLDCLADVR